MDIELVTDPDACVMYIVSPLAGVGGGILWRLPAYSLYWIILPPPRKLFSPVCACLLTGLLKNYWSSLCEILWNG